MCALLPSFRAEARPLALPGEGVCVGRGVGGGEAGFAVAAGEAVAVEAGVDVGEGFGVAVGDEAATAAWLSLLACAVAVGAGLKVAGGDVAVTASAGVAVVADLGAAVGVIACSRSGRPKRSSISSPRPADPRSAIRTPPNLHPPQRTRAQMQTSARADYSRRNQPVQLRNSKVATLHPISCLGGMRCSRPQAVSYGSAVPRPRGGSGRTGGAPWKTAAVRPLH
jgi:hypothetical protein